MIYFLFSTAFSTLGIAIYITKESLFFLYNIYKRKTNKDDKIKYENIILMIEDKINKQNELIYNLQFELEEKIDPKTTHGFELI